LQITNWKVGVSESVPGSPSGIFFSAKIGRFQGNFGNLIVNSAEKTEKSESKRSKNQRKIPKNEKKRAGKKKKKKTQSTDLKTAKTTKKSSLKIKSTREYKNP
jgi:hypothetical protein